MAKTIYTRFCPIDGATINDERPEVGDFVKLVFGDDGGGEGMWVKVTEVVEGLEQVYEGELDNEPIYTDLELGAKCRFNWSHIREVQKAKS